MRTTIKLFKSAAGPSRAYAQVATAASAQHVSPDLPPNIRFEGFEHADEPVVRGFRLHSPTEGPIRHPLSSLASESPLSPTHREVTLPQGVFALPLRRDILHRCVVWYLALLREGNQSSKNRSTVHCSGRKLRQQKGTGKARVGDASSGIRRGGAPIHALNPRDHSQLLPRKVRALGLATALSSKLSSGHLRVVEDLNEAEWAGTAEARRALCDDQVARFGTPRDISVLFIHTSDRSENFYRAVRNIEGVEVLSLEEVQVWHVLKYQWTVLESSVVQALEPEESGEDAEGSEEFSDEAEVEQEEEQRI